MRRIRVIGIGAGHPEYLTVQAIAALNEVDVFFVADKGDTKGDLVELRRHICERYITEPDYRFVELPDPVRGRGEYQGAVKQWHAERAALWGKAIASALPEGGVGAFLAWGDPSLYDSTLRILDAILAEDPHTFDYDVLPGITAVSALTARHRIVLNGIGEPVLITTGRRLLDEWPRTGTVVVMLDGDCAFRQLDPSTQIWWGAYLGTEHELLVSGAIGEVGERIAEIRASARAEHGWIMDTYLLRSVGE
ncbi:precorrin-6A synthase (deacetylating) [Mycobacteroides chelonae]|jgi:precorrin-6A synthase|uniref:Precorrin-6A synthase (Deacetylating) n=1 Tax=Mycobacteroides chelonae TaxID=1774 RepID=A0AB73TYD8_MYCCH|nr:precorrin-6A synthase (deacetylating) [Mycobacteroides chelonae]OHT67092.1 precorrin-6A synthase (deacetylating) [Mycobacteroides chelonae]OHT68729.1 precorrin-6A synthase (deacetylating) [Mycobacteroides chelonae]OHT83638.1 precorrin-6A synthase (deacetylating) [Mycobacteroides chelonae]OHU55248.1 precorrin-6A synthase (deacetylating) [Mycobacteroides chelonae]QDF69662.1 precorrin-6A synthase (deacetylating) [Mycobacteroides chelonae]